MDNTQWKQEAVHRYLLGENTTELGRSYRVAGETVRNWLAAAGVSRRSRAELNRLYSYRLKAFQERTVEAAYYAGLLMADGNITHNKRMLQIALHQRDLALLEGLREFLTYTGSITLFTRVHPSGVLSPMASLRITAPDVVQALRAWGVVPRKSRLGKYPTFIKGHPLEEFYLRGLFDGDGCVHLRPSGKLFLSFCGTPDVVDGFRDWCWRTCRQPGSLDQSQTYHVVRFGGKRAAQPVGLALYRGEGPRLLRKETLITGGSNASKG